nr:hypothetical protein [Chitinophagaceae bacterium]
MNLRSHHLKLIIIPALFLTHLLFAQNVGIGTNNPQAALHVFSSSSVPLHIESSNSTSSTISFITSINTAGSVGAFAGRMELM